MTMTTGKHLHIKRRMLREVLVLEAELHTTPQSIRHPARTRFLLLLLLLLLVLCHNFQTMINAYKYDLLKLLKIWLSVIWEDKLGLVWVLNIYQGQSIRRIMTAYQVYIFTIIYIELLVTVRPDCFWCFPDIEHLNTAKVYCTVTEATRKPAYFKHGKHQPII